ncbi:MAG TPA: hypothetical protein VFP44_13660 [Usitatibacter sp.]|nr:hypothetical protein [Usitatibacter sp.]
MNIPGRVSFLAAGAMLASASLCAAAFDQPPQIVSLQEYFDAAGNHYTMASPLAGPPSGRDWRATGFSFAAFPLAESSAQAATAVPLCRFHTPPPSSSVFLTADAAECNFLKTHDTGWVFDAADLKIGVPHDGGCAAPLTPVYRFYNNRAALGDSNHRYVFDDRLRATMAAQGWTEEGIAFCAFASKQLRAAWVVSGRDTPPAAECATQPGAGSCIALIGLLDMDQKLVKLPPPAFTLNPAYTPVFAQVTGWIANEETIWTSSFAGNPAAHSFVQWQALGQPVGVHLNGVDRQSGDYASISPTYRLTPAPGTIDSRMQPWADRGEHDLVVNFQLAIKTVRRANEGSHLYGGPIVEFVDTRSDVHLMVRVLAYGTIGLADGPGLDPSTSTPMVSTSFRADPLFGRVLKGDFVPCSAGAAGGSCDARGIDFSFRIDQDDFRKIVSLARPTNPLLSPDIADYAIVSVQVRNETLGEAEVGLVENAIQLLVTD